MKKLMITSAALALFALGCNSSNDKTGNIPDSSASKTTTTTTNSSTSTRRTVEVTPALQNSFAKSYPNIQNVEWVKYEPSPQIEPEDWQQLGWTMPDTSDYTANFAMDNSNYMSWYTPEGDWIGSMTTVDTVNVPAPVITSVHTQYVGYDLGTVTKFKNKNKTQ